MWSTPLSSERIPTEKRLAPTARRHEFKSEGCCGKSLLLGSTGANATGPGSACFDAITLRRSRFAFSPRASATEAIEMPRCWQAAIAAALNSSLCVRRRRRHHCHP